MKLIRLPSGPLACVFPMDAEAEQAPDCGKASGVFRAFSGSVEADGVSEDQAIEALDERVRRLSSPPPAEIMAFELSREAANDIDARTGPGIADTRRHYTRYSSVDTKPASSSRR